MGISPAATGLILLPDLVVLGHACRYCPHVAAVHRGLANSMPLRNLFSPWKKDINMHQRHTRI
jgi:hypothetical protein